MVSHGLKIAINGFGRIGRIFFRQAIGVPDIEILAINDLGSLENIAYLLKYDSVYGRFEKEIKIKNGILIVDGRKIKFFSEKDPGRLPWKELGIDVVVESTGVFDSYEKAEPHLKAGAKRVVITAPAKDSGLTKTATPNVGVDFLKTGLITSNASCTTNAVTPVAAVMMQNPGVKKAILNTAHGYTATQGIVDGPAGKDFRRGRAAGANIIPSSTGAGEAAVKAIPALKGKFDGVAIRVPVISGSLADFTFLAERKTSAKEINDIFRAAAAEPAWQGILTVTEEPLVSSDILRQPFGAIVDLAMTRVVDGDLVKVFSWYDNEWGYGAMLLKHVEALKTLLL
ncbi:MAG: type I glyceraldehyde-3-phosphate dehydrogenase [Candidatus Niyogibacteria bacterium]|nr:type I glyceraldehyde-3-phosphate dehydrogenase [Candidatus Niyogibacteria bacterium]